MCSTNRTVYIDLVLIVFHRVQNMCEICKIRFFVNKKVMLFTDCISVNIVDTEKNKVYSGNTNGLQFNLFSFSFEKIVAAKKLGF